MIARLAFTEPADEEVMAVRRENLVKRFKPALMAQPGFLGGYWLLREDGTHLSLTFWKTRELMDAGGRAASATPLLPGHRPEQLQRTARVEVYEVWEQVDLKETE